MKTVYTSDIINMEEGKTIEILGWVYNKRIHGNLFFIDLRDSKGIIQITIKKGIASDKSIEIVKEINKESSIKVLGIVKKDPRAPNGVEIICKEIEVIGPSYQDFPIKPGAGTKFLFDNRHLYLRSRKVSAIMKIRSAFLDAAREWFKKNGFIEVDCPIFITAACEGGATLFPVDYFGRKVYLSQSVQLYQEAAIGGLEKVYSIQPSFRAELSRTRRHLTEFWQIEAEIAFAKLEDIMIIQENLLNHIVHTLAEKCIEEFKILGKKIDEKIAEPPYEKITYDEALDILHKNGVKIEWGEDFGTDEEKVLCNQFEKPFFVTHYPRKAKAFYHMPDEERPEVVKCVDLLAPKGYGEISGGGQRIHDHEELLGSIKLFNLDPKDYEWYIDLRKYGSIPHSGFGLGVERTLRWLLELPHIRSVCLFPRTPSRVYP
ncbi:MAG: asparagine--tRNA ligase [Nitrososphaerota archaeon]